MDAAVARSFNSNSPPLTPTLLALDRRQRWRRQRNRQAGFSPQPNFCQLANLLRRRGGDRRCERFYNGARRHDQEPGKGERAKMFWTVSGQLHVQKDALATLATVSNFVAEEVVWWSWG